MTCGCSPSIAPPFAEADHRRHRGRGAEAARRRAAWPRSSTSERRTRWSRGGAEAWRLFGTLSMGLPHRRVPPFGAACPCAMPTAGCMLDEGPVLGAAYRRGGSSKPSALLGESTMTPSLVLRRRRVYRARRLRQLEGAQPWNLTALSARPRSSAVKPRFQYSNAISSVMARVGGQHLLRHLPALSNSPPWREIFCRRRDFASSGFVAASKAASSSAAPASCLLRDDKMSGASYRPALVRRPAGRSPRLRRRPRPPPRARRGLLFQRLSFRQQARSTMSAQRPWPALKASVACRRHRHSRRRRPSALPQSRGVVARAPPPRLSCPRCTADLGAPAPRRRCVFLESADCSTLALTEKAVSRLLGALAANSMCSTSAAAFASWYASFTNRRAVGSPGAPGPGRAGENVGPRRPHGRQFGDSSPLPSNASNSLSATCSSPKASSYPRRRRPREVLPSQHVRARRRPATDSVLGERPQPVVSVFGTPFRDIVVALAGGRLRPWSLASISASASR